MFKPLVATLAQLAHPAPEPPPGEAGAREVFKVLSGFYGVQFWSKYQSGIVEDDEDSGIVNARRMWGGSLMRYDAETVKLALAACRTAHVHFPPNLPEFLELCEARRPREVYPAPPLQIARESKLRTEYVKRSRAIIEKHRAQAQAGLGAQQPPPETLDGLKQMVAQAVGLAGGDESRTLLALDHALTPRGTP